MRTTRFPNGRPRSRHAARRATESDSSAISRLDEADRLHPGWCEPTPGRHADIDEAKEPAYGTATAQSPLPEEEQSADLTRLFAEYPRDERFRPALVELADPLLAELDDPRRTGRSARRGRHGWGLRPQLHRLLRRCGAGLCRRTQLVRATSSPVRLSSIRRPWRTCHDQCFDLIGNSERRRSNSQ